MLRGIYIVDFLLLRMRPSEHEFLWRARNGKINFFEERVACDYITQTLILNRNLPKKNGTPKNKNK